MGFFDRLPAEPEPVEPPPPPRPPWLKPEDTLPGVAPVSLVLAHNGDAAVTISGLLAYPSGFEFSVSAILHQQDRSGRIFGVTAHPRARFPGAELPPEFLRIGIEFSDGTSVANVGAHAAPRSEGLPTSPILIADGGGGGGRRYDQRFWVWPLPPAGPTTFYCLWPAYGIDESSATLAAQPIIDAAGQSRPLWPEDPGN